MDKVLELFSSISNEELRLAIQELKESRKSGIIPDGIVRKYKKLVDEILGYGTTQLFMIEVNLYQEAAFRWLDTRDLPEFNG
jgi:hypothetical protein